MITKFSRFFISFAVLFISLSFNVAYSQDNRVNTDARKAVDVYLKGMKILELTEGKQMVAATSWPDWGNNPVLLKYETIYEGMFDTDIASIKGYKRLLDAQVKSKAGTPLEKRILVVAYPGARDKKWRVLVFSTGTDIEEGIAYGKKELGNTKYIKDQFNYRFLAYWYAAAGRLNDSYQAYKKAADLNRNNPDDSTPQADFDVHTETLVQIMGN